MTDRATLPTEPDQAAGTPRRPVAEKDAGKRSLAAYLALPRPDDARAKMPMAVLVYGLVWFSGADGDVPVWAAVVAWLAFELLLYQGRYLLNDLADAEVDRLHAAAASRSRLPAGADAARAARRALVGRAVLWAVVVAVLPGTARIASLVAAAGLVAATASYEAVRAPMRRRTADDGPPGLGAALPVFLLVGAGYAVRIGLGAALAGASADVVAVAAPFGWALGTAGVVMIWSLEAAGLRAAGDTATLARKAHIGLLARLIGESPQSLARPNLSGGAARLAAALAAVAAVAGVGLGVALTGSPGPIALAALIVAGALAGPMLMATWPSPWAGYLAIVVALAAGLAFAGSDGRVEMALLLTVVTATVAVPRTFTPATVKLG
jgi:4-hydroxybenzoate polyprenyltransferase